MTIDTMCINARAARPDLNRLKDLNRRGLIKLTTTPAMRMDLESDLTKYGEARRQKAARLPCAAFGFMVGRSMVGGPDVIGGPDLYAHVDEISGIIAPGIPWEDIDGNTQRDILHLSAHLTYAWDIFVTEDRGVLLEQAMPLFARGIRVMTPHAALHELEHQGIS